MSDIDAFRQQSSAPALNSGPAVGLGGWLILPLLGLIFSPFTTAVVVLARANLLAKAESIAPDLTSVVIAVVAAYAVLGIVVPIALLIPFFGKKRFFPICYVILLTANALLVLIDIILAHSLLSPLYSGVPIFDATTTRSIIFAAIGVVIWIPYILGSVRANNTFVN